MDSFQGHEAEVVIVSAVRTQEGVGFMADRHRMNVMLSRAKLELLVVGNWTYIVRSDSGLMSKFGAWCGQQKRVVSAETYLASI